MSKYNFWDLPLDLLLVLGGFGLVLLGILFIGSKSNP